MSEQACTITLAVLEMAQLGKFADIRNQFLPSLRQMIRTEDLETSWMTEIDRCGPVVSIDKPMTVSSSMDTETVTIRVQCQAGTLTLISAVDGNGWLTGLDLRSSGVQSRNVNFTEEDTEIGEAPWKLPATLTIPAGTGPHPGVVLIHGSGPNDRDESIGPNKPFLDLAWGLASRGVAVLRYEKRTRQYPRELGSLPAFTVFEETIDDAGNAIKTLMDDHRIDSTAVFALGHSLGGYLMPRIAVGATHLAGAIFLAASYRPLETVMVDQIDYICTLPETTDEARKSLMAMREQALLISKVSWDPDTTIAPLGVPASYWRDLAQYRPDQVLRNMGIPALFLQGEADYQVSDEDFRLWQEAAQDLTNVVFKQYPHLNHCFLWTTTRKATPASYALAGHVVPEVIEDIVTWIKTGQVAYNP